MEERSMNGTEASDAQTARSEVKVPRCLSWLRSDNVWVPGAVLLGILMGLVLPPHQWSDPAGFVSHILGWTYFAAWSGSFYPQVVLNFRRRSVTGLSLDFQLLNAVGFGCYGAYNMAMYFDHTVQKENRKANMVQINDVVFSVHAFVLTLVTLVQICVYWDYPPLQSFDKYVRWTVVVSLSAVIITAAILAILIGATSQGIFTWLVYFNMLSQVKVVISVVKYCPQVWMNYERQSTDGFNIYNVILDFTGGFLSVSQLVLDAWMAHNWSAITGDIAKLMLGNISMFFDIIFMLQHFVLYRRVSVRGSPLIVYPSDSLEV